VLSLVCLFGGNENWSSGMDAFPVDEEDVLLTKTEGSIDRINIQFYNTFLDSCYIV
jgi:hypothetical protein